MRARTGAWKLRSRRSRVASVPGDDQRGGFAQQWLDAQDSAARLRYALDIDDARRRYAKRHDLDQSHHLARIDQAVCAQGGDGDAIVDVIDLLERGHIDMQDAARGRRQIGASHAGRPPMQVVAPDTATPMRSAAMSSCRSASLSRVTVTRSSPQSRRTFEIRLAQQMPLVEDQLARRVVEFVRQDGAGRLRDRHVTELHRGLRCARR